LSDPGSAQVGAAGATAAVGRSSTRIPVHDAKPGVETFRVAHEDDLGLNEDVSVGDQRGGEPFGLAGRCWRAGIEWRSLPALDPIRGVRACLRCCCPRPVRGIPSRAQALCSPNRKGNRASCRCLPLGNPARCTPAAGPCCVRLRCPRELDVLLLCVGSRGMPAGCTASYFPRKATGVVHHLSLSDAGHSALNARVKW